MKNITYSFDLSQAVALYMDKPNVLIRGEKTYIEAQRVASPFRYENEDFVPVKFFAESIGAVCNADNGSILIEYENKKYVFNEIICRENIIYAPIRELCSRLGLHLFLEYDLIIYSKQPIELSWKNNLSELCKLCESFIYDDVTGNEIVDLVRQRHPHCAHPRMIMTEDKFEYLREEYRKGEECEPVYKALFNTLTQKCDEFLETEPCTYVLRAGIRLMHVSDIVQTRCLSLALMYNITGNEKYAARARTEIMSACAFPDWHPYHFLDTGIMVCGIGLAYDWLYNRLSSEDREIIKNAIIEKGLAQIMNDYDYKTIVSNDQSNPLARTTLWNSKTGGNWRFAAGFGVAVGALAICDELSGDELVMAERSLSQSLIDIRPSISCFAPDGAYGEGVGYWNFSSVYWQRYAASLVTAAGSDFGYFDAPGMKHTNSFLYAVSGPAAAYAYHDVKVGSSDVPTGVLFWAKHFKNYAQAKPRIKVILDGRGNYHDLLFYDHAFLNSQEIKSDLDFMSDNAGIFASRSGWKREDFWLAFHADTGIIKPSHRHADGGSFALQAMGEEFFFDLGSDDYNVPNYRQTAYRCRAEGHNGILFNPGKGQYGIYDMQYEGESSIDIWKSGSDVSFAQADITDLWREDLIKGRRGVKLYKNDKVVIVQDELVMKKDSELYWFAHTRADVKISPDGKTAELSLNGKKLFAKIIAGEGAMFSVMEAKPLATSPECHGQNENTGVCKLTVHIENVQNLQLAVGFCAAESLHSKNMETVTALTDWNV